MIASRAAFALENTALRGQLVVSDVDTPAGQLTYSLTPSGAAQHGTVLINADGTYTYTPDAGFSGSDSFTYYRALVERPDRGPDH